MGIAMMDVLDKKEIVEQTLLDDDIYCFLMKHQRKLSLDKGDYVNLFINGKKDRLHRYVLNYSGTLKVDHFDGNPLNNQKSNLRIATDLQNAQNRGANKNSTSRYVGISFQKSSGKWRSNIQGEDLGYFDTEEKAVIIRNKKAVELNTTGSTYRIEIYNGPTEQIENNDKQIENNDKQLENNDEQLENNDKQIEFADRLIKQIEIYNLLTKQIKNDESLVKNFDMDNNKLSIKYEEITEDILYKKYIMNINKVNVLYKEVMTKKLNVQNGGPIKVKDINLKNLDEYKKIIIDSLYPS